ncbi:MAG TPA: BlaI/MecI/CopY family transcriptional regulator [Thermoanaerobaculia bacterium]|jgi:predicted transcriptional regulator
MPRKTKSAQLTPLELEIMKVLWDSGPAPVQAVQRQLPGELAYTTVQTMLNVLWRKGKVKRTLIDRAYHYRAAVTRQRAEGGALRDLVERLFGGSAEALVMALMETRQLTPDALQRLREMTEERDE